MKLNSICLLLLAITLGTCWALEFDFEITADDDEMDDHIPFAEAGVYDQEAPSNKTKIIISSNVNANFGKDAENILDINFKIIGPKPEDAIRQLQEEFLGPSKRHLAGLLSGGNIPPPPPPPAKTGDEKKPVPPTPNFKPPPLFEFKTPSTASFMKFEHDITTDLDKFLEDFDDVDDNHFVIQRNGPEVDPQDNPFIKITRRFYK